MWPTANYSVASLTVQSGAVLTIGGGSTVTVASGLVVAGNSSVVLQSINNSGKVNGVYAGAGVTIQADSVQVGSGSSINADGQGYLSSARFAEAGGASGGSGGSYGGLGGYSPGPTYGSATAPMDLGSGGAGAQYYGSNGGGAIRLIVSGTLINNGIISANGQAVLPAQGGAGAGGSVYVTTATLAGSGTFAANGGSNTAPTLSGAAAGGGGRVAVYYAGPTSFTGFATSTASGGLFTGTTPGYAGANGTVAFFDTSSPNANLTLNGNFNLPAQTTATYGQISVQNGASFTVGANSSLTVTNGLTLDGSSSMTIGGGSSLTVTNGIVVTGTSTIALQSINNSGKVNGTWQGTGVTIHADSVQVGSGSSIQADGQGYLSSARFAEAGGASGGSGGSYGGLGGYSPGPTYGSATAPVNLGSGGAGAQYYGSNGGGAIRLIVSGTLINNGIISANGQAVLPAQGGAGAGGSVYVTTATLAGSGTFAANGGSNTAPTLSGAAAGGGGRVAVYYAGPTSFTGFATSTASGGLFTGTTPGYAGANGTVAFFDTSSPNANLTLNGNFNLPAQTTATYGQISVQNGASFTVGANSSLTVTNGLTLDGSSSMTIGGGSSLTVTNGIVVTGTSTIALQSINNSGKVNGTWQGTGVTIHADSAQVDPGSSIQADGQGYINSMGPGAQGGAGGSYGGLGGNNTDPTFLYGSASAPVDLGSGGSGSQYGGSSGGGVVRLIVSGTLRNDGIISADGAPVQPALGGGGAGGSVWVTTGTLSGAGSFRANGGANTIPAQSGGASGGGGRVAIYYGNAGSFTGFTTSIAAGGVFQGAQGGYTGSKGTVAFFDTSGANNKLNLYQDFSIPASTPQTFSAITLQNGSTLTVGGGSNLTVTGAVLVTGSSNMVLQSINNGGRVNGGYVGVGVTLQAGSVQVDPGSTINADGQGYLSSARFAEAGGGGGGSGGSYGGLGGYTPGPTYGSATAPVDLGSGGAGAQYYGSNGGGAIRLIVSATLTNNGIISANGQAVLPGQGGAGAGGSVYVTTATLAGSGTFTANGGSNTTPDLSGAAAGGGGRVAVYYAGPSSFTGFAASTASGGMYTGTSAGYAGTNGTAIFFDTSVSRSNATVYQHYEVPANTTEQYNALNIAAGASVTLGGGSQLTVSQTLQVTGAITALSTNNTARNNGKWLGKGVVIAAGSVQIDATGSINADAQGYPQNAGPGAGTYTTGGSYGGQGSGQPPASVYGSTAAPIDLGSGGGGGQNNGGGSGGGAIKLLAAGTLTNNGVITAIGGSLTNNGYGAGGSGGSIYVQANTIQGSGTYSADGGSNLTPNTAGGGGGGGRIAINYITNNGVSRSLLTVHAGTGSTPTGPGGSPNTLATDGTISFVQNAGLEWLQPTNAAVHGAVDLEWFTDTGIYTTVNAAGPQTSIIAMGGPGLSIATWQTTGIPDGAYELRLTAADETGEIARVSKSVVVNNSVTWVSGTVTANTHWTANVVYAIEGDLIIPAGITLTIDPGTVVKSLANYQIIVQSGGTLTALGGASNPVIFTTFDDATVGGDTNFGNGTPQPGEWGGISVDNGSTLNTNIDTFIRYGHGLLGSTITSNTTLFASQVYEISGNLIVTSGSSLTVQPGAVVKFDAGSGITVNPGAALIANGTLAQPIYFTSINDQSVGANLISQANPNATLTPPAPGDWNSIVINGAASFNFAHVLYGGGPIPTVAQIGMLQSGGGATTITLANSTLAYSYYIGIEADAGTWDISNSVFYGNQDRAVNNFATVHIVNSTFDANAAGPFNHGGAMDIANSVITGFTNTQFGGTGGGMTSFLNNDVYTSASGVPRYINMADPTGSNGNISAAPVYMNGAQHDYRPTYGSPLIDAGTGSVANYPLTDAFNDPRYNAPLVTVKQGTADSGGKYPDIGAFEFVQSAPSDLDLTASAVQGPASAIVGTQVQVTWTVTNVGVGTVYGPWHDAIYLVRNPGTNPVEVYAGEVLSGQGVVLGPGATYSGSATISVPGTTVGEHSWEVKTNVRGEVFEGANSVNNKAVSINPVDVDLPLLTAGGGSVFGTFAGAGQSAYYKVVPSAPQSTSVRLALLPPATGIVQLFVGGGYVPTPQHYDHQQVEFASSTASLVIPSGAAQTYYVTAYAQSLSANAVGFTITAAVDQFSLTAVTPNRIFAAGASTLSFLGGGFTGNTTFNLVGANGAIYPATSVFISDSGHAQATFSVAQIPSGSYTAQAVGSATMNLANAVTVTQFGHTTNFSSDGVLQTSLQTPTAFRHGFPALVTLNYTNISGSDLAAPMIYVSSDVPLSEIAPHCDGCSNNLGLQYGNTFTSGLVLGIDQTGAAGILPAGASGSISFLANPNTANSATFQLSTQTIAPIENSFVPQCGLFPVGTPPSDCSQQFQKTGAYADAASFCASLTPGGASAAGYTRACMLMLNKAGFSYITKQVVFPDLLGYIPPPQSTGDLQFTGFNNLLAADATALSANGVHEYDVQRLLAYELQIDGIDGINGRYHQGVFGFGPGRPFDLTADMSAGGPTIHFPDGSTRTFVTVSPTKPNVYLGAVGDFGTVTIGASSDWTLTEADGRSYHFPAVAGTSRQLDYLQDRNGNRSTLTYANSQLVSAQDAFGNTLSYQYDDLGHVTQFTDASGKITSFTYTTLADTLHSTFLTSVTDARGTTTISWNQGGSHGVGYINDACVTTYCESAIGIASIAYPDNTHTYFQYDAIGRLIGRNRDGGAQAVTYSYGTDGSTTTTDALGNSARVVFGQGSVPSVISDALGSSSYFHYDPELKPVSMVGPLGDSSSTGYDGFGNPISDTSAWGSTVTVSYDATQNLTSVTDPVGNLTSFTYDASNNATAWIHPNGDQVKSTFDAHGNVLSRTNRRGNTTTYTYLPNGLIASKTFANGTQVLYTYDARNNPQSVTTATGSTTYTYNAADQVTSITNSDGTSLRFTYNTGGQRIRMTDSTGFVTNYTYDQVGRLATLTDAGGVVIVSYSYDANGNLSSKTLANGTSATYTYDANGRLLNISNRTAANGILSQYDYTYDAEGNPLSLTSPSGNLTYAYDLDGQLTSAATGAGTIQYGYDATGNRTQVTTNGVQRTFLSNNLNQYTAAGSSAYQYDADGNMISGDGWTYAYDDENHLLSMIHGSDSWAFQYDGLANRVRSVHNGVVTRYLIDPIGYGNIEAEFDGSGAVTAHYTYGRDLTTSVQASGGTNYYHFDGTGNTTQLTNSSGTVVNSYTYLPFGEKSVLASGVQNPFTYNGQWGVRDEGSGLYFMRNRWYNPDLGRFQQTDPTGLQSGINRYKYASNSPMRFNDPLGLRDDNFSYGGECANDRGRDPDYLIVSGSAIVGGSYAINLHNGKRYGGGSINTGAGANVSYGYILDSAPDSERAALTDNYLGGASYGFSAYVGGGGGIFHSPGTGFAIEIGAGGGGHGGGGGYAYDLDIPDPISVAGDAASTGASCKLKPPPPPAPPPTPCGTCLFKPGTPNTRPIQGSIDPNGKLTSGFGDLGFVPSGVPVTYTIYFENQPTATLPAQKVIVTDALAANLDWSTVELNQVNFNNVTLTIPDGTQTYRSQATVSTDANPVSVVAALDPASGIITWTMQSVDPVTGGTPANPLAGFLPPNGASNAGVGSVVFTVRPKTGLTNGTAIANQASIVFDVNAPIPTNTVTNTIDSATVTSTIDPLPSTFSGTSLPVSWSGSDGGGSGIASYNIYVSTDNGPYQLWLSGTTLTAANYSVYAGHTFSFVSLAVNHVGIAQAQPAAAQMVSVTNGPALSTPVVKVTPASASVSATQSLAVTVAVTGSATPTGSVTLNSGAYTSAAIPLTSGAASILVPAGALANGTDILTVVYAPDPAASSVFSSAMGTASVTVTAAVSTSQVSVGTVPSGQSFSVDGTVYTTPQSFTWTVGSVHILATTSPQGTGGVLRAFSAWSDGGALSHSVTSAIGASTYTANFSTSYLLSLLSNPAAGGSISPVAGTFYPAGTAVSLTATPSTGYAFASWTGSVANSTAATTTITMNAPQSVTGNFTLVPVPVVSLSPGSLTFTTTAGVTSAAQAVQLANTGTGVLTISGISIAGTGASAFAQTNTCGTSLAAGTNCTISITFASASAGTFAGILSVSTNATGTASHVTLSGTATAPPTFTITADPTSQKVVAGGTASYVLSLTPQGGPFVNPITLSAAGLPSGATATFTPATVTLGATAATSTLTIRVPAVTASLRPVEAPSTLPFVALSGCALLAARRRLRLPSGAVILLLLLSVLPVLTGCGVRNASRTSTITVTATSGSQTQSTTVQLSVR
jgi:RHS repeat-associated protein